MIFQEPGTCYSLQSFCPPFSHCAGVLFMAKRIFTAIRAIEKDY